MLLINFLITRSDAKKGNPTKWKKFNNLKDAELFIILITVSKSYLGFDLV